MTAHDGPLPVPARITWALDAIGAEGPQVDIACGTWEGCPAGDVDAWERGDAVPTPAQIAKLAKLTRHPVGWFYRPVPDELAKPHRTFICQLNRRPGNRCTVVESSVDWSGVARVEELTPPKTPYRPRTRETTMPARTPGQRRPADRVHVEEEDKDAPGTCRTCHRPTGTTNKLHVRDASQLPAAPVDPQQWAAGERRPR